MPEVTGTDIQTGAKVRMIVPEVIKPESWLHEERFAWFHNAYGYASCKTLAINALSKTLPEELYFAVSAIIRGGLRGEHKTQMLADLGLKMEYDVVFHVVFQVNKPQGEVAEQYEATFATRLPFIPFEGMHVGPSQFLTVTQVHWLGDNMFRADIAKPHTAMMSRSEIVALMNPKLPLRPFLNWQFNLLTWVDDKPIRTPIDL